MFYHWSVILTFDISSGSVFILASETAIKELLDNAIQKHHKQFIVLCKWYRD